MMPRFSPPTAIGLPRRRGSDACSTEAKKASASKWTMERGRGIDKVLACVRPALFWLEAPNRGFNITTLGRHSAEWNSAIQQIQNLHYFGCESAALRNIRTRIFF